MEYVTYILVILVIMGLCHLLLRDPEQDLTTENELKRVQRHSASKKATQNNNATNPSDLIPATYKSAPGVPTPWGWPGHDHHAPENTWTIPNAQEVRDVSETLHRFVDRLVSEKQTIENREYLLKKDASLRALLEDRYGRATAMKDKRDEKRKSDLLRPPKAVLGSENLGELKTPWGW